MCRGSGRRRRNRRRPRAPTAQDYLRRLETDRAHLDAIPSTPRTVGGSERKAVHRVRDPTRSVRDDRCGRRGAPTGARLRGWAGARHLPARPVRAARARLRPLRRSASALTREGLRRARRRGRSEPRHRRAAYRDRSSMSDASKPGVTPPKPPAPPNVRPRSLVLVNTGDGKGKSTAAFGVVMRALARDWRVCVIQFLKSDRWKVGEEAV